MTRLAVFSLVMSNPQLRRVVIAFVAFNLADWARWLAVLLFAFTRGGAGEAGAVSLLQLLPAAVVAPLAASLGDRFRRDRILVASYVAQAGFMAATAGAMLLATPAPVVYAFAILGACSITLTRPAHGALLPSLARTPAELTAANAVSGTMEGLGILIGQAVAGLIVQLSNPGIALAGAAFVAAAAAVITVSIVGPPSPALRADATQPIARSPLRRELAGGFRAVATLAGPRTIVLLLGLAAFAWGALDVLLVVLVFDLLHLGAGGVGVLNALAGAGGLLGAGLALVLAGRIRLVRPYVWAMLAWGIPLAVIGLFPGVLLAGALLAVAGSGRTIMDVVGRNLLQRSAPDRVLTRVFGVLEGTFMGAFGLGAFAAPALLALVGAQGAFVVIGLVLPVGALVGWRSLVAIDRAAVVPMAEIELLRGIPMFAPLEPSVLERLAGHLERVRLSPGAVIIREGEPGDRVYVVAEGEVDVTVKNHLLRTQGPGTEFGEIALLRNVPRTATVTARTEVELLALRAGAFLDAVSGLAASRRAADRVIDERLGSAEA